MKNFLIYVIVLGLVISTNTLAQKFEPANPNVSAEAKALIQLYYEISGKYTLSGQHNYPNTRDRNTRFAAKYAGQTRI
jgi:hypothetical protein